MTNALLIIAPRKPERFDDVEKLARRAGWNVARRTELRVDADPLWDGDLRLPQAIIRHFGVDTGLSVFLASQVPPGTGLGSSSTAAVALIKAMAVLRGDRLSRYEIAELACQVEIEELGMPIGKQDQYAAAFGGLNFIEFTPDGVRVEREGGKQVAYRRRAAARALRCKGMARNGLPAGPGAAGGAGAGAPLV